MSEMLEIEMKFRAADPARLEEAIQKLGALNERRIGEEDLYFNAPDRDFARTDEAVRIRRIGSAGFLTYKGPKIDASSKTRVEVEVPLAEGEKPAADLARLLRHLGYREVAVVRKERRLWSTRRGEFPVEICLDQVEEVGCFAELEIQAPAEQLEAARTVRLDLAATLGLADGERRSYLEMLLERRRQPG